MRVTRLSSLDQLVDDDFDIGTDFLHLGPDVSHVSAYFAHVCRTSRMSSRIALICTKLSVMLASTAIVGTPTAR
jgi:hypothetical protein